MSFPTGLTEGNDLVVLVAKFADRGAAVQGNVPHFAAGHLDDRTLAFLSHKLSRHTCRTGDHAAASRAHLNVVDEGTDGNGGKGKRVAELDVDLSATDHDVAHLQAIRAKDVLPFAVFILHKRDVDGAVRIVLDADDLRGNVVLIPLKVDNSVFLSVAAADVSDGDLTRRISAAALLLELKQGLFGGLHALELVKFRHAHSAATCGRGIISLNSHLCALLITSNCRRTRCSCCSR